MEYKLKIGNKTRVLNINVVPYMVHKIMSTIEVKTAQLKIIGEDETIINQRILELRQKKEDGWFQDVRALRKELKEMNKEVLKVIDDAFFTTRFDAVKLILSKNSISEDDILMDRKTWEEDLDSPVMSDFINSCISKDKKKVT